jgi:lipopolysaccharide biosynthesis glycosyltransferase
MIDVVLCADANYARYGAVVIASVMVHARSPERLRFHLLTPGLSEEVQLRLHAMVEAAGSSIAITAAEPELPDDMTLGRFGISSLLPLYMHHYLPADCERVIYLDCDVVVLKDLAELWDTPLEGQTLAAAMDLCNPSNLHSRHEPEHYFNTGVLLVDLLQWRAKRVGERALACLKQQGASFKYPDQDALNHVLSGDWLRLSPAWNFQPTAYAAVEKRYPHLEAFRAELKESIRSPGIVHFIGATKPWHPGCVHPLQRLFLRFSCLTPWPITEKGLKRELPLTKRFRLAMKQPKIWRRSRLTQYPKVN